VSIVKKAKPTPEDLKIAKENIYYYVYDVNMPGTFSERYAVLKEMYKNNSDWVLVPTFKCDSHEEVLKYHSDFIKQGYEGSIVRQDSEYEEKRSKNLLKLKDFKDDEFEILDIIEGVGNRSGMVGYIKLKTKDQKEFNSSLQGTWEYATQVLQAKEMYIGTLAKVKFFEYTPDGIPRFPSITELNRLF
jgi:DNA ligase-1